MEWSQAELAEKIDISTPFMTYIEHGTRGVSMETIETLAVVFGIPYAALFEENAEAQVQESKSFKIQSLKEKLISSVSESVDEFFEDEL